VAEPLGAAARFWFVFPFLLRGLLDLELRTGICNEGALAVKEYFIL
jgi:hypothetical protein